MFVILKKKEYDQMKEDLACAHTNVNLLELKVMKLEEELRTKDSTINTLQLTKGITETNLKEEMKRRDLEWYAKWSDEVQKRAAVTNLLRQEMDRNIGLGPDEDDDEGELV